MPWTQVTNLGNSTFNGTDAETAYVRNSALLLTLGTAGDGYHHLVDLTGLDHVEVGEDMAQTIKLGFVSNGQLGVRARAGIRAGDRCAWSVNATDMDADPLAEGAAARGRDIRQGLVTFVSTDRSEVIIQRSDNNDPYPSHEDVIYFNFLEAGNR